MATLVLRDTYLELEKEMESINKLRADTASQIQEAASHGDLKENYEYKAAKEKMEFVVWKKQLLQSHAPFDFIEYSQIRSEQVEFGNIVKILEEGKDKAAKTSDDKGKAPAGDKSSKPSDDKGKSPNKETKKK